MPNHGRQIEPNFGRFLNIRSATNPVLSPGTNRIAFLSDITGNFQVWSTALDGTPADQWPRQLTHFADKVWELHGSPATEQLLAVGDVGGNERQQFYLISNYGALDDGDTMHEVTRATVNDEAIHRFGAWSNDGNSVLYTCNARNGVDFDLYILDLPALSTRMIAETAGNQTVAAWSPDHDYALMLNVVSTGQNELFTVDIATGAKHHVTADQPPARYSALKWTRAGLLALTDRNNDCGALCRIDPSTGALEEILTTGDLLAAVGGEGELDCLAVSSDARVAALTLNCDGYSRLYVVDLQGGTFRPIRAMTEGVIANLTFDKGSDRLVCDYQAPKLNPDIWIVQLDTGQVQAVTHSNRAGVNTDQFVAPKLIRFPTFDERTIPAYLYLPSTALPPGGYPCILYVHGGPAGQQRPDFDVRFQYFLARGYALLATNVRGSTGYGRDYMGLDDVELRMDSVRDLKHAVVWLHGREDIANDRIAIYGRSYGGFMVLAAMTEYPELFAAGIDVVGIANWITFLERTSAWRRAHREREYGSLVTDRTLLERISPIHKADRIAAPLLVIAGDNDPRVPLYESEQIVERVRNSGGIVDFLHYADEGHRISKLANRIDSFTHMAGFLDQNLG